MTAMPLEEHSLYEREQLARIDATSAAPESFDPIAVIRRVEAACDVLDTAPPGSLGEGTRIAVDVIRDVLGVTR